MIFVVRDWICDSSMFLSLNPGRKCFLCNAVRVVTQNYSERCMITVLFDLG